MRDKDSRDGIYWRVLDSAVPDFGRSRVRGLSGQRSACEERAGPANRCVGLSAWLQFLHSVGLLRASYRPEQEVCAIRSLLRHRESLVQMAATHVHHMQKALDQMNLQLHHVISDITGQTGLTIVDAILAGQRDPLELAKLRGERIKASEAVIAKSLVGDYRH